MVKSLRKKAAKRAGQKKAAKKKTTKTGAKASEEFGGDRYNGDDWKRMKRKHPRGFPAVLGPFKKFKFDDGAAWFNLLEDHEKYAKVSIPSGKLLAEEFGDDMDSWEGRAVHVTPTQYQTGWGAVIEPIVEDPGDDEIPFDDEEDEAEDDELIDEDDEDVD